MDAVGPGAAPGLIEARHPEMGRLFAAIDGSVRFTEPGVRASKLAASLAPFPDVDAAREALLAMGATIEGDQG